MSAQQASLTGDGPSHDFEPPAGPPPLLTKPQLRQLAQHGHVSLQLPHRLDDQYQSLFATFSTIFGQPVETKRKRFPSPCGVDQGYTLVEGEKEFITFNAETEPGVGALVRNTWRDTALLLCRALGDIARTLDAPFEAFTPLLDGCLGLPGSLDEATPTFLRVFNYFPDAGSADRHQDLGLLTLCVGSGRGLQLWQQQDTPWIDAGDVTLLVGESLHILSSARVTAGSHRVVPDPLGRTSIVFALRMSTKHTIDLAPFGGHGLLNAKEFWNTLQRRRYNVNERKEVREQQKLQQKRNAGALTANVIPS